MPGQEVPQAFAQARNRNRTCIELFSALEGRARSEPGSGFMSTSIGGRVSCRGAIVRTTACAGAEFSLTAPTNTALIWVKSLRRFAELALRYEESIRRLARDKSDKDKPFPKAEKIIIQFRYKSTRDNQWRLQPSLERQPL
eukprot:scaffold6310_cov135-Isochrysis_galbana.AAC.2